jgi:hypothetical protein
MATARNFSMSGIYMGHHNLPTFEMSLKSDNVEFVRYCGGHFENGDRKKYSNVGNQFGTSLSTHISNFDDIGQMADISKILHSDRSPLEEQFCVKFYVSIIIHLEVININVRNFNFPIGFYSNPHHI